jgi:hypothetical protein
MSTAVRRRWLRFSLRGLLAAFVGAAAWLGWNAYVVRERRAALAELRANPEVGISLSDVRGISWVREQMGDRTVATISYETDQAKAHVGSLRHLFAEAAVRRAVVFHVELPPHYLRPRFPNGPATNITLADPRE